MTIQFNRAAITPGNVGQSQLDSISNQAPGASGEPLGLGQQVEAVKDKTGMVAAHLIPLQQVARDHNCIIGIRPVDRLATELIESGHPTKGFHIKGKSAS